MNISINHEYTNDLIPAGRYEFIISAVEIVVTRSGSSCISAACVIRNDVEQGSKNKRIRHQIWQKKEPNQYDRAFGGYNAAQINTLCKAAAIPHNKSYSELNELFADLSGRVFEAEVYHDEWNSRISEKLRSLQPSKYSDCGHVWNFSGAQITEPPKYEKTAPKLEEISTDDDLPF